MTRMSSVHLFSPRERQAVLDGLLAALQTDERAEFLVELQDTLVASTEPADILRALKGAVRCFFREARVLDEMLGLQAAGELELSMREYVELIGESL